MNTPTTKPPGFQLLVTLAPGSVIVEATDGLLGEPAIRVPDYDLGRVHRLLDLWAENARTAQAGAQ